MKLLNYSNKLAIILIFFLTFSNQKSFAKENIYCIVLEEIFSPHNRTIVTYKAYSIFKKNTNSNCSTKNDLPENFKTKELLEINEDFFKRYTKNIYTNANTDIPANDLQSYIDKNNLKVNLSQRIKEKELKKQTKENEQKEKWEAERKKNQADYERTNPSCSKSYDVEWSLLPGKAVFTFKSKSEKPIIIKEITLKTEDRKVMRSKQVEQTLRPFEILMVSLFTDNLNIDLVKYGSYSCDYGTAKTNVNNYQKNDSNEKNILRKILGK